VIYIATLLRRNVYKEQEGRKKKRFCPNNAVIVRSTHKADEKADESVKVLIPRKSFSLLFRITCGSL
jgi:hypothetical protein